MASKDNKDDNEVSEEKERPEDVNISTSSLKFKKKGSFARLFFESFTLNGSTKNKCMVFVLHHKNENGDIVKRIERCGKVYCNETSGLKRHLRIHGINSGNFMNCTGLIEENIAQSSLLQNNQPDSSPTQSASDCSEVIELENSNASSSINTTDSLSSSIDETTNNKSATQIQKTLHATFLHNSSTASELDRALVRFCAFHSIPFLAIESQEFHEIIYASRRAQHIHNISRRNIQSKVIYSAKEVECRIRDELGLHAQQISLCLDMGTDLNTRGLLTTTIHYIKDQCDLSVSKNNLSSSPNSQTSLSSMQDNDQLLVLQTRQLETIHINSNHTGQNIATFVNTILCKFGIQNKISSIVSDNASNMNTTVEKLKQILISEMQSNTIQSNAKKLHTARINSIIHINCFSHSLQLCVQVALNLEEVKNIIKKVNHVVSIAHRSCKVNDTLMSIADEAGTAHKKTIISCPTRWSSELYMLQRYIELHSRLVQCSLRSSGEALRGCLPGDEELNVMKGMIGVLEIIEKMTNSLGAVKQATLCHCIGALIVINKRMDDILLKSEYTLVKNMANVIKGEVLERFFPMGSFYSNSSNADSQRSSSVCTPTSEVLNNRKPKRTTNAHRIRQQIYHVAALLHPAFKDGKKLFPANTEVLNEWTDYAHSILIEFLELDEELWASRQMFSSSESTKQTITPTNKCSKKQRSLYCDKEPNNLQKSMSEIFFEISESSDEEEESCNPENEAEKCPIVDEVNSYLSLNVESACNANFNILRYWAATTNVHQFPRLCRLARFVLSIPASSVSVERSFSELKRHQSRLRGSLSVETIDSLMKISRNRDLYPLKNY